jgi:hypothetical protein
VLLLSSATEGEVGNRALSKLRWRSLTVAVQNTSLQGNPQQNDDELAFVCLFVCLFGG